MYHKTSYKKDDFQKKTTGNGTVFGRNTDLGDSGDHKLQCLDSREGVTRIYFVRDREL